MKSFIEVSAQVNVVLGRGPKLEVGTVGGQHRDAVLPGHGRIGHDPCPHKESPRSRPQKQTRINDGMEGVQSRKKVRHGA